jgi:pullulanase/glycogen debranching enzyme
VALFKEIVSELHARGIRVVLDGVFNHTVGRCTLTL